MKLIPDLIGNDSHPKDPQWRLSLVGTATVNIDRVVFQDTTCAAGTTYVPLGQHVFDGGNNGLCFGFIKRGAATGSSEFGAGGGTGQTGGGQGGGGGGGSP